MAPTFLAVDSFDAPFLVFLATAGAHGPAVGAYARALLDIPLPWTRMRQVYALLGLVKKWGPARVDAACARALEAEAISVSLIGRMLDRATENQQPPTPPAPPPPGGRFARAPEHFASGGSKPPHSGATPAPDRPSTGLSEDGSEARGGAS